MYSFLKLLSNRNSILIFSVILGLTIGDLAHYIKGYTIFILALVMMFSTTGIDIRSVFPLKNSLKIMLSAITLNYLVGTAVIMILSLLFIKDTFLLYGMVVIGASPPGIAVIPFSLILKGDLTYSIIGTLGTYLSAVIIAPLIILIFTSGNIGAFPIFLMMVKIIIIPIMLSRLLRIKMIYPIVEKIRGRAIDIGFAFIIFIAVGLNRRVFFSDMNALILISSILLLATFGLGFFFMRVSGRYFGNKKENISQMLLLTIKSSGFTAATSLALFGERAAIPSAIMSVVILVYLLFLSIRNDIKSQ
ncbi:MAG: hypothetical protein KAR14_14360 [Candidatus Aminicenantes bacterium]|nr:hypothetical protein [Candidatus Aminicenantes bacterium]